MSSISGKRILIGVTGGIAIYKVLDLISKLKKSGAELDIIMTEAAVKLVAPITFQTMGRCRVHTQMFEESSDYSVEHIELAKACDLMLIAPATANTIAKINAGIADNLLTTTALACEKQIVFAAAMNSNMYNNPITQSNIANLKSLGYHFIAPSEGFLACNTVGVGRMSEPYEIVDFLERALTEKDLLNKKLIVTAGPTIERIDPVRYITNDSSGKMGYSIAIAARNRGADVVLITGPTSLKKPDGVETVEIKTNEELFNAINCRFESTDSLIMAAAPSDFKPVSKSDVKIKRTTGFTLELEKNPDIIGYFGGKKNSQIIIGFAAETHDLLRNADLKLKSKNLDYIVANDVTLEGAGFNSDTNIATIISKDEMIELPKMSKLKMANRILDLLSK